MQPRQDGRVECEGEPDRWVHSACLLCSNGCGLDIAVKDERIVGVRGILDHPVNFGHLGPKGVNAWVANNSPRRGTMPMIRRTKGAELELVDWDEALEFFVKNFRAALDQGHENLACYNSGQLTIEEFYTLGKLWRGGLQSSNIDGNTRLCTATSATGLMANFGADGPVASYADIDQADLLCLYGHNVAESQTVLWERMLEAKRRNNGRIIVVDPRKSPTVRQGADLHLQVRLGTNVALMNGLIHLLIRDGRIDRQFISQHTVGFESMQQVTSEYPPERVAQICGIDVANLEKAAEWIGSTSHMVSTVLQGFYQAVEATAASSLVNSVHLLTGAIGKPGCGPLLMAGQPSAMSNREAGADGSYPGYRNPHNKQHMKDLAKLWNIDPETFHPEVPNDILKMLEVAERGEIEFMWVIGTNPIVSLPDQNRTRRILDRLFLVVQDPFVDAESVALADIYFPVAMWGEKTGCVTNAERSVNLMLKAVEPPGRARSDFDIFVEVARRLGFKDRDGVPLVAFADPREAFDEWRCVSKGRPCDYSGMTYELILEKGAVRWPWNAEHPQGTNASTRTSASGRASTIAKATAPTSSPATRPRERLRVHRPERKGISASGAVASPAQSSDRGLPVRAVHWSRGVPLPYADQDGPIEALNRRVPDAYVEIHPEDADRLGISLGDWVEVSSRRGHWEGVAMVVDTVRPGELFIPFHFGKGHQAGQPTLHLCPRPGRASSRNSSPRR